MHLIKRRAGQRVRVGYDSTHLQEDTTHLLKILPAVSVAIEVAAWSKASCELQFVDSQKLRSCVHASSERRGPRLDGREPQNRNVFLINAGACASFSFVVPCVSIDPCSIV